VTAGTDRGHLALLVHEVRSPVAAIAAIAEALTEDDIDVVSLRELTRLAVGACRSIARIVGDAAVSSVRLEPVDVGRLVRDAAAASVLGGGRVRAVVSPGVPPVDADSVRMRQALDNLIENAVIHSSSQDEVVVAAGFDKRSVLVSVSDSGRGVPPEEQARILEPGVRLDSAKPGSGWGLSVVRTIAEAHGGTLDIESEPGRTSFTIVLPLERR
jgi:two-component system OmpR family sensor kinase